MIGIYNAMAKKFQFGISEPTAKKARNALFKKIGWDSAKWRFETRYIPGSILSTEEQIANRFKSFKSGRRIQLPSGLKGSVVYVSNNGYICACMDDGNKVNIGLDDKVTRLKNYM